MKFVEIQEITQNFFILYIILVFIFLFFRLLINRDNHEKEYKYMLDLMFFIFSSVLYYIINLILINIYVYTISGIIYIILTLVYVKIRNRNDYTLILE